MRTMLFAAAGLGLSLALPAMAAQSPDMSTPGSAPGSTTGSTAGSGSATQAKPVTREAIKNDLQQAGFTNIKVLPESFLVRADDKQGHPVMMILNPDSLTAVTALGTTENSNGSKSGSTGTNPSTGRK